MTEFTHAYCDLCQKIQPVEREELEGEDTTREFLGGDMLCTYATPFFSRFASPSKQQMNQTPINELSYDFQDFF